MNSIEIAKKLIRENDELIEDYRQDEKDTRERIANLEAEIKSHKEALAKLEDRLASEQSYLNGMSGCKKETLVNNLALKMFIADGGGLDMLD